MKLRKKAVASFVCSVAMFGNSFGILAQDKGQTKVQTQSGKVIVRTADGQTKEVILEGNEPISIDQNGPQIRIVRDGQGATVTSSIIGGAGQGGNFFFTQDGPATAAPAQDFIFVRGQAEAGQGLTYSFVSSEMSFDTNLVKGAPFSADIENETIQTLGDGNRIIHKSNGAIYRDGEGRTRRETTISAVGPFAGSQSMQTITINDPVAGSVYTLEPHNRIARKGGTYNYRVMAQPALRAEGTALRTEAPKRINIAGGVLQGNAIKKVQPTYPAVAKAAKAEGPVQVQITVSEEGRVTDATVISGHPLLRDAALEAARQWEFKPTELGGNPVKVQGILTFNFTLGGGENKAANSDEAQTLLPTRQAMPRFKANEESLGKQTLEGVEVEGKRITTTIPAGTFGNERPIEIVNERWFSPELKTVVMSRNSDPRTGETTYRLVNLRRGEPDASLFQVPPDYTVKEGGLGAGFGVGTGVGVGGVGGSISVGGLEGGTMKKRTPNQ
jgi:TonB family protein